MEQLLYYVIAALLILIGLAFVGFFVVVMLLGNPMDVTMGGFVSNLKKKP